MSKFFFNIKSTNSSGRSEQENATSAPPKMKTLATIETFAEAKKRAATSASAPSKKPAASRTVKAKQSDNDDEEIVSKRPRGASKPAKKRNRICTFTFVFT